MRDPRHQRHPTTHIQTCWLRRSATACAAPSAHLAVQVTSASSSPIPAPFPEAHSPTHLSVPPADSSAVRNS